MALTGIGDARTPATPVEVTFAADTGQPTANQEVLLFGRLGPSGNSVPAYTLSLINNSGDPAAAKTEADGKFGTDSEASKMVQAAIFANAGRSIFPQLKVIAIANGRSDYGASDEALTAAQKVKAEFLVIPYDAPSGTLMTKLKTHCALVSSASRTANNQFGTMGVVCDRVFVDPSTLPTPDDKFIIPVWLRDTGVSANAPTKSVGEVAAAAAAVMAGNAVPFNPLDDVSVLGVAPPLQPSDWPTVGDSAESESALQRGWTPLYVKPNGEVAFVRTITSRLSVDGTGTPIVGSYYDVQDFQVLYLYKKTIYTRFVQPDFKKKASGAVANRMKSEAIRLAQSFEDQEMFQAVSQLAKEFVVQRVVSDRHAFECKFPVNVVPGLHRKKVNIQATTEFDSVVA